MKVAIYGTNKDLERIKEVSEGLSKKDKFFCENSAYFIKPDESVGLAIVLCGAQKIIDAYEALKIEVSDGKAKKPAKKSPVKSGSKDAA